MAQYLNGADLTNWDGWINLPLTPTYVSATSFTYPADITGVLAVGDKLKFNNSSTKYFYITSFSVAAGVTTVNVTGGSDYAVANSAISGIAYSKMSTPNGHPIWFNYSETWTGYSAAPSGGYCRFKIDGRLLTLNINRINNGTSNATTNSITLPAIAANPAASASFRSSVIAVTDNSAVQGAAGMSDVPVNTSTCGFYKDFNATAWTASGGKNARGSIYYEI